MNWYLVRYNCGGHIFESEVYAASSGSALFWVTEVLRCSNPVIIDSSE